MITVRGHEQSPFAFCQEAKTAIEVAIAVFKFLGGNLLRFDRPGA